MSTLEALGLGLVLSAGVIALLGGLAVAVLAFVLGLVLILIGEARA